MEPSGALSVAALRFRPDEAGLTDAGGSVVAVVSGGNVDPERYQELLTSPIPELRFGWRSAGRPRPGSGRRPLGPLRRDTPCVRCTKPTLNWRLT